MFCQTVNLVDSDMHTKTHPCLTSTWAMCAGGCGMTIKLRISLTSSNPIFFNCSTLLSNSGFELGPANKFIEILTPCKVQSTMFLL